MQHSDCLADVSIHCFHSGSYHPLFVHPCAKLELLVHVLSIILIVALIVALCLKTQEELLQQEVTLGEKTADMRIKRPFKWK